MSIRYRVAPVFTLKRIVSPRFTLMSVANPWMLGSPSPLMSHLVDGLPGLQFSATISLAGAAHGEATRGALRCSIPESPAGRRTTRVRKARPIGKPRRDRPDMATPPVTNDVMGNARRYT